MVIKTAAGLLRGTVDLLLLLFLTTGPSYYPFLSHLLNQRVCTQIDRFSVYPVCTKTGAITKKKNGGLTPCF